MSTGQPPSGDRSGGEKHSKSGQKSSVKAAERPDAARRAPALSVDDGWDVREVPSANHAPCLATDDGPAIATGPSLTGPSTVPPVASVRGKFTVGNLLSSNQASDAISKRHEGQSAVHRQQIGALPHSLTNRGSPSSPPQANERRGSTPPQAQLRTSAALSSPSSLNVPLRAQPAQRRTTPPQPFAAQNLASGLIEPTPRKTPPQFTAVLPAQQAEQVTRPRAAAASPKPATERVTPSQPFAAVALEVPKERVPGSQPFTALASPMVSVGSTAIRDEQAPPQQPQVSSPALNPRDLLAPELHETTPKGIGVVTISSPPPASQVPATAASAATDTKAGSLPAARIIPIATVPVGEIKRPEAAVLPPVAGASDGRLAADVRPVVPAATPGGPEVAAIGNWATVAPAAGVKSQPPPPAPVLDDPDGWEVGGAAVAASPSADPPPAVLKVEPTAVGDPPAHIKQSAHSAKHKSPAKVALAKAKASKGKLKASTPIESAPLEAKKTPSSHSKLLRAGSGETDLSGEFFAAAPIDEQSRVDAAQYQETDDLLDARDRRSLSPEVVARRARYRILVVLVIVGFVLLLGAAIALKVLHRQ